MMVNKPAGGNALQRGRERSERKVIAPMLAFGWRCWRVFRDDHAGQPEVRTENRATAGAGTGWFQNGLGEPLMPGSPCISVGL
jgi:hypothetical protein